MSCKFPFFTTLEKANVGLGSLGRNQPQWSTIRDPFHRSDVSSETPIFSSETPIFSKETAGFSSEIPRFSLETTIFSLETPRFSLEPQDLHRRPLTFI